jgi:diguanylate cyclase (GGDEF)-like protein/PAS domain S-box-containing protein
MQPKLTVATIRALAEQICEVSIAVVSFLPEMRQRFMLGDNASDDEPIRSLTLCDVLVHGEGLLVVPDTLHNTRFLSNPAVLGPPHIRFFAGAPLRLPGGDFIGSLCLLGDQPRQWSSGQRSALTGLAAVLTDVLSVQLVRHGMEQTVLSLRTIVDTSPQAIYSFDRQGQVTFWSPAAERMFGWANGEVIGQLLPIIPAEERQAFEEFLRGAFKGEPIGTVELIRIRKDGSSIHIKAATAPLIDSAGNVVGVMAVAEDVTQRKHAEEALRANEEQFRIITEHVSDLIAMVDTSGRRIYNSPSYQALFGDNVLVPGSDSFEQIHPDDRADVVSIFNETVATGIGRPARFRFRLKDGSVRYVESSGSVVRDSEGRPYRVVIVSRDITDRFGTEQQLRHLAHHDMLTGLPNRALLLDRLEHALTRSKRASEQLAVMFIDLDNFKDVNDVLGHEAGDNVLRIATERLRACLRGTDTLARQGGDEFIVLLEDICSLSDVGLVAQKIVETLLRPISIGKHNLQLGASVGISLYPSHGVTMEELLKRADAAMYHAKAQGKNRYEVFTAELDQALLTRHKLKQELEQALERREFIIRYQPRVSLITGQITVVEALLRWNHPERGLLSPMQFLSLAEETGLIVTLSEWVLREACRQTKQWHDVGCLPIKIAVNVSGRQFRQKDFTDVTASALAVSGLPSRYLEMELTENVMMYRLETSETVFAKLREMGVAITIDDFGTGYSSLSYLKRFQVDAIKIDKSFVRDVVFDKNDAAIVKAILALAKSLDIAVIAEGIETVDQANLLTNLGCDEAQGYFFYEPMPADALERVLKAAEVRQSIAINPLDPRSLHHETNKLGVVL